MAKDNITLLQDISNQLKRMNQDNVRSNLEEQKFRDISLSQQAGADAAQAGNPAFIDPAEDFRRRLKGSTAGAIAGEKFTASGKRARDDLKTKKKDKIYKVLGAVRMADKRVGLSTLHSSLTAIRSILITQGMFWESMLKQDHKQFDIEQSNRLNDKRSMLEDKRETNKMKVIGQTQPMLALPDPKDKMPKKGGLFASLAKMWLLARALPALIGTAAVLLATAAIKDFVDGWKADGLSGAIGKMLGGSGKGIWNAIKQSFKVGGLGAVIGGAIGFLFGGVGAIPGAIIGGLIGMAIGAVAGYFGGDRITAGLKDATKAVAKAWEHVDGFFLKMTRIISDWIFTPGTKAQSANHGAVKSKLFGGFISWDPGEFSIGAAWTSAMDSLKSFFTNIGLAIYNPEGNVFFGGTFLEWTAPAWFDGIELGVSRVWQGLKDFAGLIKSALINMLPDWLTDQLGWTVDGKIPNTTIKGNLNAGLRGEARADSYMGGEKTWMGDSIAAVLERANSNGQISKVKGDYALGATNAGQIDGNLVGKMTNFDADGIPMGLPGSDQRKRYMNIKNKNALMANGSGNGRESRQTIMDKLADKKFTMDNYLSGNKGGAGGEFHSHTNTDASTNKGAVTVIQHLYADGSPTKATMTIHDHMDLNYGMSYNGYN